MIRSKLFQLLNITKKCSFRGMCVTSQHDSEQEIQLKPVNLSYNVYENEQTDENVPPLVIMHGLLGSKQNWNSISKALLKKLQPSRKIISVDARNHGESPHTPFHAYPHLVADLVYLFDQLSIKKAAVLGHSMGGRAMMCLALQYPQLVDRAIIVDISPVRSSANLNTMAHIFNALKSIQLPSNLSISEARAKAAKILMNAIQDKATVDFTLLNLKKSEDGNFAWKANIDALENYFKYIAHFPKDLTETRQFNGPILFIGGTKSDFIRDEDILKMKSFFPTAHLKWLETGHLVQLEKPSEFISIVNEFLS